LLEANLHRSSTDSSHPNAAKIVCVFFAQAQIVQIMSLSHQLFDGLVLTSYRWLCGCLLAQWCVSIPLFLKQYAWPFERTCLKRISFVEMKA